MTELDASFLHITDETSPVKVTFLTSAPTGHHMFGYFFADKDGRFGEAKILFPKVHRDTLISSVSAVFLSARAVSGKKLCFFAVQNGFDENVTVPCFQDVVFGRNGTLKFFEPPQDPLSVLMLDKGVPVWKSADKDPVPAVLATTRSSCPVLVWQGSDATLSLLSGTISFSLGGALSPLLNGSDACDVSLMPEETRASFVLSFKKNRESMVSVRLNVGERNFTALTDNLVGVRLMPDIPDGAKVSRIFLHCENARLFLDGFDKAEKLSLGEKELFVRQEKSSLTVTGEMDKALLSALMNRVRAERNGIGPENDKIRLSVTVDGKEYETTSETQLEQAPVEKETVFSALPSFPETEILAGIKEKNLFLAEQDNSSSEKDSLPSFLFEKEDLNEKEEKKDNFPVYISKEKTNKTVLVTGGAKRIGRAICEKLASKGWNVVVHCHQSMAEAGRLVDDLKNRFAVDSFYVRADLSDMKETADLIPSVMEASGKIDALVNAAAVFEKDDMETLNQQSFNANMSVNLQAPFFLAQSFAKVCDESRFPAIVNLLDQRVLNPTPYFMSYTLSKSGLALLTRTMALALAPKIRVNGIALGDVLPSEGQPKFDFDRRLASTPLKKEISLETVAKTVLFLLENPNMTGVVLPLDNGQSMNWSPEK